MYTVQFVQQVRERSAMAEWCVPPIKLRAQFLKEHSPPSFVHQHEADPRESDQIDPVHVDTLGPSSRAPTANLISLLLDDCWYDKEQS